MKRITFLIAILIALSFQSYAQRFAYVNTEYVLKHIPEYQQAQEELDKIAKDWREEVERRKKEIEEMYKDYQAEQVLLSEEMKKKREQEIIDEEQAVQQFQKEKFGYEGELYQKRRELVKPIQDKVYNQVQQIAKKQSYDFIFDKSSGGLSMLYANDRYNVSDDVVKAMGHTPGQTNKGEEETSQEEEK